MTVQKKETGSAEVRLREKGVEFALWLASNEALKATPENAALKVLAAEVLRLRAAHQAPQAEPDLEAIEWAYRKLCAFGVQNGKSDGPMWMDRLNLMLLLGTALAPSVAAVGAQAAERDYVHNDGMPCPECRRFVHEPGCSHARPQPPPPQAEEE